MKGVLHAIHLDLELGFDDWVDAMLLDAIEGLELRLAFEAWADRRGSVQE